MSWNSFPVPDGDTGRIWTMTIMSAVKEVSALEKATMPDLAKAISSGSCGAPREFGRYLIPAAAWFYEGYP